MGPIFIIVIAVIASMIAGKLFSQVATTKRMFRLGGAIIGAFLLSWLVGSAMQDASFMMSPPGPLTLLGGLVGGFVGAFVGSIAAARQQPADQLVESRVDAAP